MSDSRNDLPPVNSPNFLEKVREALSTYLGTRGNKLDRGLTVRDLSDAGLVELSPQWLARGGRLAPVAGAGSSVVSAGAGVYEPAYEPDLTAPPMPTGFTVTPGITHLLIECAAPTYTEGHGHAKSRLYGATWTSGALPVFDDAVVLTEFSATVASHATNPSTTWHLWLTWVTVDGVESTSAAGGTNGVVATTGQDVALLIDALAGEITATELHTTLGTRIDLIDAPSTTAGSVAYQVAQEALARANALADEVTARNAAIAIEASDRAAAVLAEATARGAAIAIEASDRAAAVLAEATARGAAITNESDVRQSADNALATSISLLTAGVAGGFDVGQSWYFDSTVEGWTSSGGTQSWNAGYVDLVSTGTDPQFLSPTISVSGAAYSVIKARVKRLAGSGWDGSAFYSTSGHGLNGSYKKVLADPSLAIGDTLILEWDMSDLTAGGADWLNSTVTQIRLDIGATAADQYSVDWVAVGRNAPGASQAGLLNEQTARISADDAEVALRAALATKVTGAADPSALTLATISAGLLFDEKSARSTADSSEVTARQTLSTKVTGAADPSSLTLAALSSGLLYDEKSARSTADSTEVTARQTLSTTLIGATDATGKTLANITSGMLFDEKSARSTADSTEVTARQLLSSTMLGATDATGKTLANVTSGIIFDERTARTNADTSQVTRISTLEATVNNATTGVNATAAALDTVELLVNNGTTGVTATATKAGLLESKLDKVRRWELTAVVNGNDASLITLPLYESDGVTPFRSGGVYPGSTGPVSYRVEGRITATGTATGAVSVFTSAWSGSAWVWTQTIISEAGTSSNHVKFYLNVGVPSVRLWSHTVSYTVAYSVESSLSGYSEAASIKSEATTRATEDSALSTRIDTVTATVNNATTGLSSKASIGYVDTAKADAISSAASTTALVQAQLNTGGATQVAIASAASAASAAQTTANTAVANASTAQSAANTAQTTANTASANAATANTALTNLASDNILSPVEKPSVVQDYAVITAEQAGIDAQATAFAITTEKTNYDAAVTALTTYLGTLTGWNAVPGSDVVIVGTTFRTKFSDVYTKRQLLLNAISAKAKTLADAAQTQANTATSNAATAQAAANAAQTQANTATTNAATAQTTANTAVTNAAAVATRATALETSVNHATTGLATKASVTYVDTAKADAISTSATASQTLVSSINIGGRNYRSEVIPTVNNGDTTVAESVLNIYAGTKSFAMGAANANLHYLRVSQGMSFVAGKMYTASIRVYDPNGYGNNLTFVDQNGAPSFSQTSVIDLGGGYKFWTLIFTPTLSTLPTHGVLFYSVVPVGSFVYLSGIKIEAGNKATDWTPSPEETNAAISAVSAAITSESTTRANSDTALALRTTNLETSVNSDTTGLATKASVTQVATAKSEAISASATASQTLVSSIQVGGRNLIKDSKVAISTAVYLTHNYFLTDAIPAGTQVTLSIKGQLGATRYYWRPFNSGGTVTLVTLYPSDRGTNGVYTKTFNWNVGASANTYISMYHMPSGDTSVSTIEWVKLEYGNKATDWTPAPEDVDASIGVVSAAVQTEATTRVTETGSLFAQYTVKLDVNGKVSGYGLASTGPTGTGSTFEVRADKFVIAAPTGSAAGYVPFSVLATEQIIGGVTFPAGVYAQRAFIQDAQITNAKIANLAVDDAKISALSAAKITAGAIGVGSYIQSTNFTAGSAGWKINADGTAELANAVVRGSVYANAGYIGGITIASNAVRAGQTAFDTGIGFFLGAGGTFSLGNGSGNKLTWNGMNLNVVGDITGSNGTFTGSITGASGTFGGNVHGGQFTTGAFTGWGWPAAGNYGTYLGPSGLLIGNFNNGKYLEIRQDGNLYSPGFYVENGVMTITQANVINTANIAGNAVTVSNSTEGTAGTVSTSLLLKAGVSLKVIFIVSFDPITNMADGISGSYVSSYYLNINGTQRIYTVNREDWDANYNYWGSQTFMFTMTLNGGGVDSSITASAYAYAGNTLTTKNKTLAFFGLMK
ncbi:MAG: hypothetical protein PHD99_04830 [Candidatus Moranbacteria bacterium]|nr:hypothetical protein [Candidatus Moranbacteria bacterium]